MKYHEGKIKGGGGAYISISVWTHWCGLFPDSHNEKKMLWIQHKRSINTVKGRLRWRGPSLTCCHFSAILHRKLPLSYHSSNPSLSFTVQVWGFRKQGLAFANKGTIRSLSSARVGWLPKHFSNRSKHDKNEPKLTCTSTLSHTWNGHHFGTLFCFSKWSWILSDAQDSSSPTLLAQDPGTAAEPAQEVLQEKETGFLLDRRENSVMYSRNSRRNERSWEPGEGNQCWIGGGWSSGGERWTAEVNSKNWRR